MTREVVWKFVEKLKILHCLILFSFFLLQLVLSKFGYPMAESGHPDLLIALPMIMKSGTFFSCLDGL